MKRLYCVLCVLVISLFSGLVFGDDTQKNVTIKEVTASAKTADAAIKKALHMAVAQTRGIKVDTGDSQIAYDTAATGIGTADGTKQVDFDSISLVTEGSVIKTDVDGLVKTYEVIEQTQTDDLVTVKLKVWVYDFVPPLKNKKTTLAVMPIKPSKAQYHFGFLMPGSDIANQLSHKIETLLTQTNKFAILDRLNKKDFNAERDLLLSDDAPISEKSRLGQALGADYILTGTITDAVFTKQQTQLKAIGRETTEYRARFVLQFNVMVASSMQVLFVDIVDKTFTSEEIQILVEREKYKYEDTKRIGDRMMDIIAAEVANRVMDEIYPVKVAAVDTANSTVVINRGGDFFKPGALLNVTRTGTDIIDPDTNEILGNTTSDIAVISVQKTTPTFSYANVIQGQIADITQGQVCRRCKTARKQTGAIRKIDTTSGGGIKLPFD